MAAPVVVDFEGHRRDAEALIVVRRNIDAVRTVRCLDVVSRDPAATAVERNVTPVHAAHAAVDGHGRADGDDCHGRIGSARTGPHVDVRGCKSLHGSRSNRRR
jgi:hypothetical protein